MEGIPANYKNFPPICIELGFTSLSETMKAYSYVYKHLETISFCMPITKGELYPSVYFSCMHGH